MIKEVEEGLKRLGINAKEIPQTVLNAHFITSVYNDDVFLELFLKLGADPTCEDKYAVKMYASRGDLEKLKLLKKYGTDLDIDLTEIIRKGNFNLVKFMFDSGAKIRKVYLRCAIENEDCNMINLIMEQEGASVTAPDMYLTLGTSVEVIEKLLSYTDGKFPAGTFSEVNSQGKSSRWGAISALKFGILQYILDAIQHKSDMFSNIVDKENLVNMPEIQRRLKARLITAIEEAEYETIEFLLGYLKENNILKKMRDVIFSCKNLIKNSKSVEELNLILELLYKYVVWEWIKTEKELFYEKASIKTLEILGITPDDASFVKAAEAGNKALMQELLQENLVNVKALFLKHNC